MDAREGAFSGSVAHVLLTVTPYHVRVFPRQIGISLAKNMRHCFWSLRCICDPKNSTERMVVLGPTAALKILRMLWTHPMNMAADAWLSTIGYARLRSTGYTE